MEEDFVQGWALDVDARDLVPAAPDQHRQERLSVRDLQEETSVGHLGRELEFLANRPGQLVQPAASDLDHVPFKYLFEFFGGMEGKEGAVVSDSFLVTGL